MIMAQLIDIFAGLSLGTVAHELLVLSVFFLSAVLWLRIGDLSPRLRKHSNDIPPHVAKAALFEDESRPAAKPASLRERGVAEKPSRAAPRAAVPVAPLPHVKVAQKQILQLLEDRQFTRALNTFRGLERDGRDKQLQCSEFFGAFIQSAIRVGKIDVLEQLLGTMQRNGVAMSGDFWRMTLRMLSSRKHFVACLSIHSIFGDDLPLDKVVYSCLINAALDCGKPEVASPMLSRYALSEEPLEPKDHILFFRTYANLGDVDSAEAIFHKLGEQMNTLMFNLLLLTCVKAQQPERALSLVIEARKLSPAEPFIDTVSFNTVIKGFIYAGDVSRGFDILREIREQGLEPDDVTFATLFDASLTDSDMDAMQTIVDRLLASDRNVDTATFTAFIKGLVRANYLQKALKLYHDMQNRATAKPDLATYSVLIKGCVDSHFMTEALSLVADMREAGKAPDDMIYTHLIDGCRHTSDLEMGTEVFKELVESGLEPSEYTLIALVKLLGRCGAHAQAHEVVQTWETKFQSKPSVIHYTCLISSSLRSKQYEQAWAAYELMLERSIAPDEAVFTTLLPALVVIRDWDRVLILTRKALNGPATVAVPPEMFKNALLQMRAHHALRPAELLQSLLRADRRHAS